ncbi:D-2-hydroxyacid dehydrogenase [Tamlana sp. 2_MG-2023]|uniref:D-2-hydroxyacid dehydrogenase n=1 Tax=unclassified Tamlana TaxID=2614803 RepID=UPI0026E2BF9D|nr:MULTISPECIES: D-2-hydroxyacid dehydrogenase [unclassified Tamlana]MDO6759603.1 D-2-hydroxyacid dehydrogenase [Tamlana sp. 2_MG-2023]MDO6792170.1 D-2-hydroxyacid dehydrogenase [Tamlana sp. 1_MG-2023]
MKIVVLDGYTLNPGDLTWEGLEELGNLKVYERTPFEDEAILKNIGDAEFVYTNKTPLSEDVIAKAPNLKYIGVLATGYNVVAIEAAKKRDIVVTNVPEYSTISVAQFTMALLLEMCHHVGNHNQAVQAGDWSKSPDFSFWNHPLIELSGKTMGIIGFGNIGQATAKIAQAFGLNIVTYSRTKYPELESETCKFVSLDELLEQSDIISLHCPLFEETKHIINKDSIAKMKDGVMLINTSRGPLINEEDLKNALNDDKVYSAAIDVASAEPIDPDNPLLSAKNCIITPHIAWAPKEARFRLMQTTVDNLRAYLSEKPVNVVN